MQLSGTVEYERQNNQGQFVNVAVLIDKNSTAVMQFDNRLDKFSLSYTGSLAYFFSGPFEVKKESGIDFYNYHEFSAPYAITRLEPNIEITEDKLTI